MQRWVMPVELSRDWLVQLAQDLGKERQQFEVEVFAYGHLPLAYSARCFTARPRQAQGQLRARLHPLPHRPAGQQPRGAEGVQPQRYPDPVRLLLQPRQRACGHGRPGGRGASLPEGMETLEMLARFKANQHGQAPLPLQQERDCNGYWRQIPA